MLRSVCALSRPPVSLLICPFFVCLVRSCFKSNICFLICFIPLLKFYCRPSFGERSSSFFQSLWSIVRSLSGTILSTLIFPWIHIFGASIFTFVLAYLHIYLYIFIKKQEMEEPHWTSKLPTVQETSKLSGSTEQSLQSSSVCMSALLAGCMTGL